MLTNKIIVLGITGSIAAYKAADIASKLTQAGGKVDVIMTPTTPTPAFKLGEKTTDPLLMYLSDIYMAAVNLAGLPAISIPCGKTQNLPVGLQIIGKPFEENTILEVGKVFETLNK